MRSLIVVLGLVLFLSFGSAYDVSHKVFYGHDSGETDKFSDVHYYAGDSKIVSKMSWTHYDNDRRYSTYDYRHGYSYRASGDYFEEKVALKKKVFAWKTAKVVALNDEAGAYHDKKIALKKKVSAWKTAKVVALGDKAGDSHGTYYKKYVSHLRKYEKQDCYVSPPVDKLFYISC